MSLNLNPLTIAQPVGDTKANIATQLPEEVLDVCEREHRGLAPWESDLVSSRSRRLCPRWN
jgi:hypothetical protein